MPPGSGPVYLEGRKESERWGGVKSDPNSDRWPLEEFGFTPTSMGNYCIILSKGLIWCDILTGLPWLHC